MKTRTIAFVLSMVCMGSTFGCDCKPTPAVKEAMRSSQLVIRGTILHGRHEKKLEQPQAYLDSLGQRNERRYFGPVHVNEYLILVKESFKGASIGDTLIVRTGLDPVTDCGLLLDIGEEFIVYAQAVKYGDAFYDLHLANTFTTSACTRTRPYSKKESRAIKRAGYP